MQTRRGTGAKSASQKTDNLMGGATLAKALETQGSDAVKVEGAPSKLLSNSSKTAQDVQFLLR